jgi:hypothetical protein
VHADKQEQNESMMRNLTSLHAPMAAANKAGQSRGKRSQMSSSSTISGSSTTINGIHPALNPSTVNTITSKVNCVKEDNAPTSLPVHQRPDTSMGYQCNHQWGAKAQRELDRKRGKLEQGEKQLIADIKKSAKASQMARGPPVASLCGIGPPVIRCLVLGLECVQGDG